MVGARDYGELVGEQLGLHNVVDRNRIPQGTDENVNSTVPQAMKQPIICAVQHSNLNIGPQLREFVDRVPQNVAADQGQRDDRYAGRIVAQPGIDLGKTPIEFGKSELRLTRQCSRSRREFDPLCGFVEQDHSRQPLQVA